MTQYHDPYAPLDYSQFVEVPDSPTGYLRAPVIARPNTIDSDYVGPNPRQSPLSPVERQQFEQVRQRLDRAMQVTGIVPSMPQESQSPQQYEAGLLRALASHAVGGRFKSVDMSRSSDQQVIDSCEAHGIVDEVLDAPRREGRLAAIRTTDRTGREITEYVGAKSVWMTPLKAPAFVSPIHLDGQPQRI
ncbi:hypothetical protein [Paraburkholderia xenovorans]|uniref:hypothetical protein n=1 Tax=Paraburkholderia xenovorans TaxID=36873 RepID=UPI0015C53CC1|nr:hypothetical protein [Paraburkholderia xenovorans]NPT33448.1 hypothetical protein [Paraburkholderia xenovorans]